MQKGPRPNAVPGLIVKLKDDVVTMSAAGTADLEPIKGSSQLNLYKVKITDGKKPKIKAAELQALGGEACLAAAVCCLPCRVAALPPLPPPSLPPLPVHGVQQRHAQERRVVRTGPVLVLMASRLLIAACRCGVCRAGRLDEHSWRAHAAGGAQAAAAAATA